MRGIIVCCLALCLFNTGCDLLKKPAILDEPALARVDGKMLYPSMMEGLTTGLSPDDSAKVTADYIKQWIKKELRISLAEKAMPDELLDIEKKVEDYRNSLVLYKYEQDLIRNRLDLEVSFEEIEAYFNKYKASFQLKEDIFNVRYVRLPDDALAEDSVIAWLKKGDAESIDLLNELCVRISGFYSVKEEQWLSQTEMTNMLGFSDDKLAEIKRYFGPSRKLQRYTDDGYKYVVDFEAYRVKSEEAPLAFVQSEIKDILIKKRRKEIIDKTYRKIYEEADALKRYEVYVNIGTINL